MKCKIINTKDKCFVIKKLDNGVNVTVIAAKSAKVYNAFCDMPKDLLNELENAQAALVRGVRSVIDTNRQY
jgi:hypothetical protein